MNTLAYCDGISSDPRRAITLSMKVLLGLSAITILWLFFTNTSEAAVTAFMKAGGTGVTCAGGPTSANFATGGSPVQILVCVSAPVESLCGITYRLQAASGESGRFNILSRTATSAYGALDGAPTFAPLPIVIPAAGINLGGGTLSNLPALPATDQLVATLAISPTLNASNAAYVLSLDSASVVGIDDGTGDCSAPLDQSITASITFNRATPPAFTSADSATITVGSPANFTVAASGTPAATLSLTGTLPSGMTFLPASGLLGGTPSLGMVNSYSLMFTAANGNLPDATQNFTLNVVKANQAVNFGALADRTYSALSFAVSATTSSGLPVSFSSSTPATCSVSGNSVTMLATGTCTILATQAGNTDYNASAVSRSFVIAGPGPNLVTPSAGANGSINPSAPVTVSYGATTTFTVTSNAGYSATVGGTCGGTLVGTTFTTSAITANCTVAATFTLKNYVVSGVASPGAGGTVNCASPVNHGSTTSCTITVNSGYTLTNISGCGGAPGTTSPYTTGAITSACSVTANYTLNSYVVSGVANPVAGGTVNCTSPVNDGSATSCTVATNTGYTLTSISGCGGTPGTTSPYTTGVITGACTVDANFTASLSLVSVVSQKMHGGLGPFKVTLNPLLAIGDAIPVEPRSIGAGHLIVFTFNSPISNEGSVTVVDATPSSAGGATLSRSGNEVRVTLTAIPDNKRVRISLSGVNGSTNASVSIGFLVGDISGSRSVNASDISAVKAHLNQTADASNFGADINADGTINAKDLSAVKARSGMVIP